MKKWSEAEQYQKSYYLFRALETRLSKAKKFELVRIKKKLTSIEPDQFHGWPKLYLLASNLSCKKRTGRFRFTYKRIYQSKLL
ncbi:MAG: hypothetical protein [Microvirus sp.]|nr:MAG: hypothetical protein [Microvirus sp.]